MVIYGMVWYDMMLYGNDEVLVAPPVSVKDRSLFGHAFVPLKVPVACRKNGNR